MWRAERSRAGVIYIQSPHRQESSRHIGGGTQCPANARLSNTHSMTRAKVVCVCVRERERETVFVCVCLCNSVLICEKTGAVMQSVTC